MYGVIDQMHKGVLSLNNSKYFAGLLMIIMNVFSKYVTIELSKTQESYIRNSFARQILIFSICWTATRDIYAALLLTAAFIILSDMLLNENSNFCVIPMQFRQFEEVLDLNNDTKVSEDEIQKALIVLEKAKKREQKKLQMQMINNFEISKNSFERF